MASFSGPAAPPAPTSLSLTTKESDLFAIFLETIAFKQRKTVARVAGGWVRDKLLGKESDDIDVALDDQTGLEFATSVNEYLEAQGQTCRRVGVIEANPEQSKHLETATTHVLGLSVDFVNLRAETYSDSRIPEIRFGTPVEDALRRDFTINALFYNIQTGTIEDMSGLGLADLASSTLRTPMDPLVTFRDDPLRVLRAVRFAARLNLKMHTALWEAAGNAEVREGLRNKVSRERMLKELEGCLNGPSCRPVRAIDTFHRLGLAEIVFMLPPSVTDSPELLTCSGDVMTRTMMMMMPQGTTSGVELLARWAEHSLASTWWLGALLAMQRRGENSLTTAELIGPWASGDAASTSTSTSTSTNTSTSTSIATLAPHVRLGFWASAVAGLDLASFLDKKGRSPVRVGALVLRDMLKVDGDTCRDVRVVLDATEAFCSLCDYNRRSRVSEEESGLQPPSRLSCGLAVRAAKDLWRVSLWLACARELAATHGLPPGTPSFDGNSGSVWRNEDVPIPFSTAQLDVVDNFKSLETYISNSLHLDGCWLTRPLFDGQALQKELGIRPGQKVGLALDKQMRWQLEHEHGTPEECLEHLRREVL